MKLTRRSLGHAGAAMLSAVLLPAVATAAPKTETALAAAIDALSKAMIAADKARMEALMMPSVSFGHSSGLVQTRAEFISAVVTRKEVFKSIQLSEHKNSVNGNSAIARHIFESELELEGRPIKVRLGVLQVWQKQAGKWKLYARQAYTL
jgi:hypothetical protein